MRAKTIPKILCFLMLVGTLAACSDLLKNAPASTPVEEQSTPVEESIPSSVNVYLAPLFVSAGAPVPKDWLTLESPELGIQFRLPPQPGEITYEYNDWPEREGDPTGTLVEWIVAEGETGTIVACESVDMQVGRGTGPFDITRWFFDGKLQKFTTVYAGAHHCQARVEPLRIVPRVDGLQGIIYNPPADCLEVPVSGTSAVLSLPEGYLPKIKVISFYFANQESLDEIEAVLKSVTFTK
jgi:hypothetical protein